MDAMPQVRQGGFVRNLTPEQVLGGGLAGLWKPADVLKIREMGRPAVEQIGGNIVAYDKDNPGGARVVASFPTTNQAGFSTSTVPDSTSPTGYRVQLTPGASEAYAQQQTIGEQAKADFDIVKVPMSDGSTREMTRRQYADMLRGQGTQAAPSQGAPQVFRVLDEQSAETLARQLQERGVSNFQVTTKPASSTQPAAQPQPTGGMPGITTGRTTEQTNEEAARAAGRTDLYKENTKRFSEFDGNIRSLGAVSRTLERLLALNNSGQTFTNAGANFKSQLSSIGQALGLDINVDRLAASETYQAQIAELLKQRLGSKDYGSGTGVSNLDLIAASAPLPELVRSAQGQRQIIQALAQDAKESIEDMESYRAYYRSNRGNMDGFRYPSESRAQERLARIQQMQPRPEAGVQPSAQPQGNFEVGKVYRDANGNRAIYRGNGQFEAVR